MVRQLRRDPLVVICVLFLLLLIIVALFPAFFAPLPYDLTSFQDKLAPPGSIASGDKLAGHRYILGADRLGRDMLSRLIYGTRVSIAVAFIGAGVSFLIGVTYGLISGYSRQSIDNVMMRIVDVVYGYPTLILIILLQVFLTAAAQQDPENISGLERIVIDLDNSTGGLFFVFKAGNLTEAGGSLLAAVFGMPFLGVGLFLVVWQWVMAYTAHARIRYALSTRAAYIAKRYWRRELSIFPITKTTPLEMQDTRNGATVWLHALKQEDSDGDKVTTKIGFENIADGARVLGLLRNLQARL